ncbi:LOW QUALITY PROTEIN: Secreted protein [Phytophthora megakarya]|uniref:Secreted protein n=1 Tax=Phytophthora megakarya TaxID=4795 RepID=A0A225WD29_9STRA|nr:LOW QUALITY PROTEIN: Secreted protein [Phytophthora megakarya]
MQHALSECARRSGASLPAFVEVVRGQTSDEYRPNKNLVPSEVVEVRLRKEPPRQQLRPPNHDSLLKNIQKEQDAWHCIVLDSDLPEQWPEINISSFAWSTRDASVSGRTIHDLSYPEDDSINDFTDPTSIIKPEYHHCDAVAREIVGAKLEHPGVEVAIMTGDVASAFRNISIHSNRVYLFAGRVEEEMSSLLNYPRLLDGQVPLSPTCMVAIKMMQTQPGSLTTTGSTTKQCN